MIISHNRINRIPYHVIGKWPRILFHTSRTPQFWGLVFK